MEGRCLIKYLATAALILAYGVLGKFELEDAIAQEMYRPSKDYPVGHVGRGYQVPPRPDCRPEDVIWMAYNSGAAVPWEQFCSSSYSIKSIPKKPKRKP